MEISLIIKKASFYVKAAESLRGFRGPSGRVWPGHQSSRRLYGMWKIQKDN